MSLFKKKSLISKADQELIVNAIQTAEQLTSGEVRVFIESRCPYIKAIERAKEIFFHLKMEQTKQRNGVLVYVALKDRQSGILGDVGIYNAVGGEHFWTDILRDMNKSLAQETLVTGLTGAILSVGEALSKYFPYDRATDKNELPDEIVFGK